MPTLSRCARTASALLLATTAAIPLTVTPVFAQASGSSEESIAQIGEIIVTAQKRSENLQNVPIAVSVMQADRLEAAGVTRIDEISRLAPGLTVTTGGGSAILPRIRGIGQSGAALGLENPVAIYVDGVYYASNTGSLFSLNNIEQVAVLKGPQGTLFGRNATGGLIQVTTIDPSQDAGGRITATVGNLGQLGGTLYGTAGLASHVAADLAVSYNDQRQGFGRNLANGKSIHRSDDIALRSKIKADISDDTMIKLSVDYGRSRFAEPGYRPEYGTLPISRVPFTGGEFDINSDFQPAVSTEQAGGSLTLEHDFSGVKFSSISAYRWIKTGAGLDNDGQQAPTTIFTPDAQTFVTATSIERTFSQELQLTSNNSSRLKWALGAYYFQLRGEYVPPVVINVLNGVTVITIDAKLQTTSYAAYGQATYALTDRLNLTAGLRATNETRRAEGDQDVAVFGTSVAFIPSTGRYEKNSPTWRFAADYRASDVALLYATYNRGFKSGGFNPVQIPYASFNPEKVDAYEAGLKLDLLSKRLRINSSAFYYDYTNLQAQVFQGGFVITQNATSAKIYGLDVDAEAAVSRNFSLNGGLSLLHGRYGLYPGAQVTTPDLVNGGNIVSSGDIRGTRITNTPDWTLNLGAQYAVPIGNDKLTFSADYYHNSGFYNDAENRQHQKAYNLVNGSVKYELNKRYSISAWVKNIGNVAYASQLYTNASADLINVAPGRTFGITAAVDF